jgi:hypothetical protein
MRWHVGPIPENPEFQPEEEGWRPLREPTPWVAQLLAVPVAIAITAATLYAWHLLIPAKVLWSKLGAAVLLSLPAYVMLVPIHECVHAACHPSSGRSPATIFGFWPSKLLFYAHYEGPMSRNRFLVILGAPFAALTIAPLAACAVASVAPSFVIALTATNSLMACVDLLGVVLIALQIPSSATVRNNGYPTWWRSAA